QPWPAALFDPAVARALDLLPPDQRFAPERRVSGVFSMTADNLPLLGPIEEVRGLWAAEALWVTHAAGAARALAQMMTGTSPGIPGLEALRPGRFTGQRADDLNDRALRMYRDIYATA
ncbi:MAG: FAD-dependent oxidoreductase, partial [Actinomycetota bacterium]|nr:FAD-dependent oxidoreductase [Actinomycetota bacterium]